MTQIYIKQNIHKHQTQNFRRISPFGITPVEKAHKARTRWYRGPLRRFINTRFLKNIKKEWTEAIKNSKILYKYTRYRHRQYKRHTVQRHTQYSDTHNTRDIHNRHTKYGRHRQYRS